jgi:hypothetical protein
MGIREVFRTQGRKLEVRIILNYSGEKIVLQEGEEDNIVAGNWCSRTAQWSLRCERSACW